MITQRVKTYAEALFSGWFHALLAQSTPVDRAVYVNLPQEIKRREFYRNGTQEVRGPMREPASPPDTTPPKRTIQSLLKRPTDWLAGGRPLSPTCQ